MLKRITFFSGAILMSSAVFAQAPSNQVGGHRTGIAAEPAKAESKVMATDCPEWMNRPATATPFSIYSVTGGGYVSGNNPAGDLAKANLFINNLNRELVGVRVLVGEASTTAPNTGKTVSLKVWDGASGTPGTVLATEQISLDSLISRITRDAQGNVTSATWSVLEFATPVQVSGNFFVGIELPTTVGDTVALATDANPSTSQHLGWEKLANGNWAAYSARWTSGGNPISLSNKIQVFTNFELVAGFTPSATTLDLDNATSNTITFNNTSVGGTENAWSVPGATPSTSVATHPTFAFDTAGTYTVTLLHGTADGCEEEIQQTITVTGTWTGTGMAEDLSNLVNVYPNPASSVLNLSGVVAKNVVIINAMGQVVSKQNVSATNTVDVANLSSGMYYVQIETAAGTITKKVSVQK